MAVNSGMIYNKVMALADNLQTKYNEIANLFDNELIGGRVPEVEQYYGGEAADAYKANLTNVSNRVKQDIGEIIRKLREEAEAQQQAYQKQDQNLVSNVNFN